MANSYENADALADLDVYAQIYALLDPVLGDGTVTATASMGARNIWDRRTAALESSRDYLVTPLITAANILREASKTSSTVSGAKKLLGYLCEDDLRSLNSYVGAGNTPANLDGWLTANSLRVHVNTAAVVKAVLVLDLTPANVFPAVTELGSVLKTTGTWAFTDGDDVDTAVAGAVLCEAYIPEGITIGTGDLSLSVTMKKFAGTTESKTVAIANGSTAGTAFAIGNGTTDVYVDVTACTPTGGDNADKVAFRTKLVRAIATACDAPA